MPDTETPENPSGNFVLEGQVSRDLYDTLQTDSAVSALLRDKLKIVQQCNYPQLIAAAAASTQTDSLGKYINDNMRGASSSTTQLKSAMRLFFNPKTQMKNTSLRTMRRLDTELSHGLEVIERKNLVGYLDSHEPPFTVDGNELTFTRPCRLMFILNARWGVWNGSGTLDGQMPAELNGTGNPTDWAMVEPTWRFTATGTNRTVTVQPSFNISGSLSTGSELVKLQPAPLMFQEQDIYPHSPITQISTVFVEVLRGSGAFGRVEKLQLTVERTPYVAHFGQVTDALGLFKNTIAGVEDSSNFVDVIEL